MTDIKPYHFVEEFCPIDDEEEYLCKYIKNDIIQSFVLNNVCLYNYNNELIEYCEGDLEVYIVHPFADGLDVHYSDVMGVSNLFNMAFYMKNAKVFIRGELQDYDEYIIETNIPGYISFLTNAGKGYTLFCNSPWKEGGIIVGCGKEEAYELAKWKYFVFNTLHYKEKRTFEQIYDKLQSEANRYRKETEVFELVGDELEAEEDCSKQLSSLATEDMKKNIFSPEEELNDLVGLSSIKSDVINLMNFVKMQKAREKKGLAVVPISLHLVFTGNPGTGKTTVARILASLYQEIGILTKGQLVEVDRAGLVAGYVGQTAIKTQEKINEAKGGILFIDEAYTLVKDGNDYGQEAIDTILKAMEDYRNDFIVIVAGYPDLMKDFINSNPGLKSRFNKYFQFEDYSAEELTLIFNNMCKKYDYEITDDAKKLVNEHLVSLVENKDSNFANARDVRNYFETIISKQASRVMKNSNYDSREMITITCQDVI